MAESEVDRFKLDDSEKLGKDSLKKVMRDCEFSLKLHFLTFLLEFGNGVKLLYLKGLGRVDIYILPFF